MVSFNRNESLTFGVFCRFGIYMFILSAVLWILSWIFVTCLNLAAARQVRDQSNQFFATALLPRYFASGENSCVQFFAKTSPGMTRQQIPSHYLYLSRYDTNTSTDFASRLTE